MFSCGIFLEFKKAFDTVDHSVLLHKLHYYGVRGTAHNWFTSYLDVRTPTTQINSKILSKQNLTCGVPQRQVQNTGHRSQVIVLLTQKVSQTPLKANLRPNKFLFRPN